MISRRHEKVTYINDKGEGVELSYSFPYFFTSITGTDGLDTNIYKINSPGQDGSTITNVTLGDRALEINGGIRGYSKTEIARYREELLRVFSPKSKGKIVYEYGDVKKAIECQVEVAPRFKKLSDDYRMQEFKIDLLCPNPFWRDIATTKADISTETGNIEFPLEIPPEGLELSIRTISFITNIYNPGDVDTPIRVRLRATGTVINPIIENLDTGEFIRVKRTLSEGDTLEINTAFGNKRIEIIKPDRSRENVFHYIDYKSTFFSLSDGDNTIKYDAEVGENNLDVSIYYTPRYLGV